MKVILVTLLAFLSFSPAFALEHDTHLVTDTKATDLAGLVDYQLFDNKTQALLAEGRILIRENDIIATEVFGHFQKEVKLHEDFYLGIAIFREEPADLKGFGLQLTNKSVNSFSWDWFRIVSERKATKLQGSGEIIFSTRSIDELVEIDAISFTSDTMLRAQEMNFLSSILDLFRDHPRPPDWIARIKEGSYIKWGSAE